MKITLLGTATSQGIPVIGCKCKTCISEDIRDKRLRCSALIQSESTHIVLDVGPDFRQQMLRAKVNDLDAVFLTHEHNDHIIGLDDLRPFIFRRRNPMIIYAEQRVLEEVKYRFEYAFTEQAYPGAPRFELRPIVPGDLIKVGDIEIRALRVYHGHLPILAFRIKNWAYLTDTNEIPMDTFDDLKGLEVLVIDALRREGHHSHYSLSQSIEAIKHIAPDRAYFIHMSHLLGPTAEWEQDLPSDVYPSFDGLQFEL